MREILHLPAGLEGWVWRYRAGNYPLRIHHHEELELNLVISGTARYLVDDERYDLRPNTLIWLFPAQAHMLLDQSRDYAMWVAVFRPQLLRRSCTSGESKTLLEASPSGHFSSRLGARAARRLDGLFSEVVAAGDNRDLFNTGIAYTLLSAWSMHQSAEELTEGIDLHPAVERAAILIRDGRHEGMPLDELAAEAGLSPSRLSRLFKQQTGVSLVRYRQRICLQRFLALYGSGRRRSMMHAALEAGFGSYPQFHRVFRDLMGVSPHAYRKKLEGEG